MNTEYTIGKLRIPFETRARRRWFVALIYAMIAAYAISNAFFPPGKSNVHAWVVAGFLMILVCLIIVFTWIAGDMRSRGDERETHRREHAHFVAYRAFTGVVLIAVMTGSFRGPNPLIPLIPAAARGDLAQWRLGMLVTIALVYTTLPQAILLWTEPDMDAGPEAIAR